MVFEVASIAAISIFSPIKVLSASSARMHDTARTTYCLALIQDKSSNLNFEKRKHHQANMTLSFAILKIHTSNSWLAEMVYRWTFKKVCIINTDYTVARQSQWVALYACRGLGTNCYKYLTIIAFFQITTLDRTVFR